MPKIAAVLGNGPTLTKKALASLPEETLLIGVNFSQDFAWAPIVCTADRDCHAALRKRTENHPLLYVIKIVSGGPEPNKVTTRREDAKRPRHLMFWADLGPLTPSGVFAIYYACEVLEMERVYILGFGGKGHFESVKYVYPEMPKHAAIDRLEMAKQTQYMLRRYPDVEFIRVYADGGHH